MEIDKIKRGSELLKQVNNLEDIIDKWDGNRSIRIAVLYSSYINDCLSFAISNRLQEKIIELIKEEQLKIEAEIDSL